VWLDCRASNWLLHGDPQPLVTLADHAARRATVAANTVVPAACPICEQTLVRGQLPRTSTDMSTCAAHGTWFDRDKLRWAALDLHAPVAAPDGAAAVVDAAYPARPMSRFIAAQIDGLAAGLGVLALSVLGWIFGALLLPEASHQTLFFSLGIGGPLLVQCTQWYWVARRGQTLGKAFEGIRIVRMDGSAAGFWRGVVVRSLALPFAAWLGGTLADATDGFVGAMLLGFAWVLGVAAAFDVLWILRGPHYRALHDHVAGTQVIEVPVDPWRKRLGRRLFWVAWAVLLGAVALAAISGVIREC
jgi:uncharacterized RDD family membrane protein YckC